MKQEPCLWKDGGDSERRGGRRPHNKIHGLFVAISKCLGENTVKFQKADSVWLGCLPCQAWVSAIKKYTTENMTFFFDLSQH